MITSTLEPSGCWLRTPPKTSYSLSHAPIGGAFQAFSSPKFNRSCPHCEGPEGCRRRRLLLQQCGVGSALITVTSTATLDKRGSNTTLPPTPLTARRDRHRPSPSATNRRDRHQPSTDNTPTPSFPPAVTPQSQFHAANTPQQPSHTADTLRRPYHVASQPSLPAAVTLRAQFCLANTLRQLFYLTATPGSSDLSTTVPPLSFPGTVMPRP